MRVCNILGMSCCFCWIFIFCVWLFLPVGLPCCYCPVWILVSSVVGSSVSLPVCSCDTCLLFFVDVYLVLSCSVVSDLCGAGMIEIQFACSLSNFSCSCLKLTTRSSSFCWLLSASRKITCGLLHFAVLSFSLWTFLTAL